MSVSENGRQGNPMTTRIPALNRPYPFRCRYLITSGLTGAPLPPTTFNGAAV